MPVIAMLVFAYAMALSTNFVAALASGIHRSLGPRPRLPSGDDLTRTTRRTRRSSTTATPANGTVPRGYHGKEKNNGVNRRAAVDH